MTSDEQGEEILSAVAWATRVVLPKIKRDAEGARYLFPDPLPDFWRFSRHHSWYKHFYKIPGRIYPMLRIGVESPGKFGPSDTCDGELHWGFHLEEEVVERSDELPAVLMRDASFFVSADLSNFSLLRDDLGGRKEFTAVSEFFARCMLITCNIVRDRITRILLLIDPKPACAMQRLHFAGASDDGDEDEQIAVPDDDDSIGWTIVADAPVFCRAQALSPHYIKQN
jgi:hypothetical protein